MGEGWRRAIESTKRNSPPVSAGKMRAALKRAGVKAPAMMRSKVIRGFSSCFSSGVKVREDGATLRLDLTISDSGMRTPTEKLAELKGGVEKACAELGVAGAWDVNDCFTVRGQIPEK